MSQTPFSPTPPNSGNSNPPVGPSGEPPAGAAGDPPATPPVPPKKSHKKWIFGCAIALVLGLLILIGGCGAVLANSGGEDAMPVEQKSSASGAETDEGTASAGQETASEDEGTDATDADADDAATEDDAAAAADADDAEESDEETTEEAEPVKAPSYSGSGSDVITLDDPGENVYYATVTHKGSSNFALWTVDEGGQDIDLAVNTIGSYSGDVPINFSGSPAALRVEADGDWTITFHQLAEAPRWDGTDAFEAKGDSIVIVDGVADGLTSVDLTHSGESNFAVWAWGEDYPDLIVNEIGSYEGTTLLPDGTMVLQVQADGTWSIAKG